VQQLLHRNKDVQVLGAAVVPVPPARLGNVVDQVADLVTASASDLPARPHPLRALLTALGRAMLAANLITDADDDLDPSPGVCAGSGAGGTRTHDRGIMSL
jgi:hypothetical protein